MWTGIKETAKYVYDNTDIDIIVPVGDAIESARTTNLNSYGGTYKELSSDDGLHICEGAGKFLLACTWYQALVYPLTCKSIKENKYQPLYPLDFSQPEWRGSNSFTNVTSTTMGLIQKIAIDSNKDPYIIHTY